jgi:small subunit ribosomal protein S19
MTRSRWKGPFLGSDVSKIISQKRTKIWSRSSVIPNYLVGETVFVHNGKEFKRVVITREKIGYKFGEFSLTRKTIFKLKANEKKKSKKIK